MSSLPKGKFIASLVTSSRKRNCSLTFVSDTLNLRILAGGLTDGSNVIALTCDQAGSRQWRRRYIV